VRNGYALWGNSLHDVYMWQISSVCWESSSHELSTTADLPPPTHTHSKMLTVGEVTPYAYWFTQVFRTSFIYFVKLL